MFAIVNIEFQENMHILKIKKVEINNFQQKQKKQRTILTNRVVLLLCKKENN